MIKHNLVIVSNRLPFRVVRVNGELVFEPSSGGLSSAMSSLDYEHRVWVGWPGIDADDLSVEDKKYITSELAKHHCVPVFLTHEQVENFYEGYSNDTLWPLFHYFQSYAQYTDAYWKAYRQVNKLYAEATIKAASEHASIWIHDYHLMLLPGMLRRELASASIGFFLHIPFPSYEIYRLLPERKELLEGLLGADLIGFHIYDYARHFLSSCLRLLGVDSSHGILHYDGRTIKVDAYPISIDYHKFRSVVRSPGVVQATNQLRETYKGQKIILSIDRLDYSKGIPQRLEAYRLLLEDYPEYIGKIKLVMIAVPSRTEVETYQHLRDSIEQTVSRINGTYGTVDWAPISYQFQNRPIEEIVALYALADIALVTPIRDGMNLVAKEYVASKFNQPGVLLLSEMTGAVDELPEAISINPNDTKSVEAAIRKALKMTKREQLHRLKAMQQRISLYSIHTWGEDFMTDLTQASSQRNLLHRKRMSKPAKQKLVADYKNAASRLLILDYDGTLHEFVSSPSKDASRPSPELQKLIKKLAHQPGTQLAIVSGRPMKTLQSWFKDPSIVLVAEHGAWARYNGQWTQVNIHFDATKDIVRPLLKKFVSRTAGALIEEKDYAVVWHYRNVPTELAYVRASELRRELANIINDDAVGVFSGNKIIEIKPIEIHKGYAASEIEAVYSPDCIVAIGDDYTDEEMFRDLPSDAYTIKVGAGDTKARFQLATVSRVLSLLEELAE